MRCRAQSNLSSRGQLHVEVRFVDAHHHDRPGCRRRLLHWCDCANEAPGRRREGSRSPARANAANPTATLTRWRKESAFAEAAASSSVLTRQVKKALDTGNQNQPPAFSPVSIERLELFPKRGNEHGHRFQNLGIFPQQRKRMLAFDFDQHAFFVANHAGRAGFTSANVHITKDL